MPVLLRSFDSRSGRVTYPRYHIARQLGTSSLRDRAPENFYFFAGLARRTVTEAPISKDMRSSPTSRRPAYDRRVARTISSIVGAGISGSVVSGTMCVYTAIAGCTRLKMTPAASGVV